MNNFSILFLGLWFINETIVFYLQEVHVTIWCPMRFKWFPMDSHSCKFRLGSYANFNTTMTFFTRNLIVYQLVHNTVLEYSAEVYQLDEEDTFLLWESSKQSMDNYSLTGFKMNLKRQSIKYMVNYFLPSGLFVVASWVICVNYPLIS